MTRNVNGYLPSKGPSMYVPVKYQTMVERYCRASAGPRCNLTGMRMHYWGDAPVIRCGQYCYRMQWEDYYRFLNLD